MKFKLHDVERAILARPDIQEILTKDFAEALRSGAKEMANDMAANHGRPWGFPLDKIEVKVRFWFCAQDRSLPPAMGKYLKDIGPNSEAYFAPDAGHLWILLHPREVLDAVTSGSGPEASPPA